MPDYYVWAVVRDETHVRIQRKPKEVERKYELLQGVPRLDTWPEDIQLEFSRHRPEGLVLTDTVDNAFGWTLVSGACKAILEPVVPTDAVEYLPVTILNHRGRVASDDYWIVNMLALIQAVDREASVFNVNAADDSKIFSFERLALTEALQAEGPALFRLAESPRLVLVRGDIVEQVDGAALTGNRFVATGDYSTFPRPAS